jgi:IS5 family transposase
MLLTPLIGPKVECIVKIDIGQKRRGYGSLRSAHLSWYKGFVGAKSFTGNPYDGHTLADQMKQVENLIGDKVGEMYVDMYERRCKTRPQNAA